MKIGMYCDLQSVLFGMYYLSTRNKQDWVAYFFQFTIDLHQQNSFVKSIALRNWDRKSTVVNKASHQKAIADYKGQCGCFLLRLFIE